MNACGGYGEISTVLTSNPVGDVSCYNLYFKNIF